MDYGFIISSFELGLLKEGTIDVVTFHGYHRANLLPESGLKKDVEWLRSQIRKYAPPGKQVIVVDSERGYCLVPFLSSKSWDSWRNMVYTESEQAAYLARHYLEEMSLGIEVSIWFKDMNESTGYSLYEGLSGSRLRSMGVVFRNLAALFDTNPKQMVNSDYPVTLVDLPDNFPDPNSMVEQKIFVRTYVENGKSKKRLIIALWNPIEAFDGKILESRKRIGDSYYESWRAISPEDKVEFPIPVRIGGLAKGQVAECYRYDLLSQDQKARKTPIQMNFKEGAAVTETLKVTPMPTLIVVEIQ
jgi:hypothetical protein